MPSATDIQSEIDRRANHLCRQRVLTVDYYRIRKRLAVPLPVHAPLTASFPVRNFTARYPWNIWLLWALEDRIETLGAAVTFVDSAAARRAVVADLAALAAWPGYRETDRPDLAFAHAVRILWVAVTQWGWLDEGLKTRLHAALERAVADALPLSDRLYAPFADRAALLATEQPHQQLHNIPLIGTCALALAASAVAHPAAGRLHERVSLLFGAVLELRQQGFTEGVSYDGYLLSFLADWLSTQPPQARETVYAHPAWAGLLAQPLALAAPGDLMASAPLGDVEPVQMPFVWSALAKLHVLQPTATTAWALARCALSALRADALVALARAPEAVSPQPPSADAPSLLNAALVLRSGHAPEDLALAMGLSRSPMGHVQCDNGSLVLGTAGRWWLDDPGYQQYLRTAERAFTLGPSAHNAPVIHGEAQRHKRPTLLSATRLSDAPEVQFALVDLTACYPPEAGVTQVWRAVWLIGRAHLLVCDQVQGAAPLPVTYHWHGHPELYWCIQQGEALWWLFSFAETRPPLAKL